MNVQTTGQADDPIKRIVSVIEGEMKRSDIMDQLQLAHRETFINNYLDPAIKEGYIEMTHSENPTHPKQRYILTDKGIDLKNMLE
ncbi:MAG: Fic family protein [Candidatus Cyclobacteriaceae bacterium M2_1C_046]